MSANKPAVGCGVRALVEQNLLIVFSRFYGGPLDHRQRSSAALL